MTTELTITLACVLVVVGCCLAEHVQSYLKNTVRNNIQYSHAGIVALPLPSVGRALGDFYKSMGCSFESLEDGALVYQRGCIHTFGQVDQIVNWHLVPQKIALALDSESGKTRVDICYRVLPPVRITQKAANQFVASAKSEGAKALEMLQELSRKNEAVMDSGRTSAAPDVGRSEGFADGLIEDSHESRGQPSEISG